MAGLVCGGSTHAQACTPGALYKCKSGPQGQLNNCTLSQACAVGCLTQPTTGNFSDACFSGTPPLALSTSSLLGGSEVTLTVALQDSHPSGAIVNLGVNRGDLVPGSYCAVPDLPPGSTSANFALPTAVVTLPADVTIYANIGYADASGASRQLVSVPSTLTLNPGGTEPPPPPLASFTLTPSIIGPGQSSFMDVVLSKMAPASGVTASVSSSDPSVASVIPNGQPHVFGGCMQGGGAATLAAASSVPQQTTVTVSASSGAPGQAPLTSPLTVTPGCAPKTCLQATGCGTLPDGCGGTITCGCPAGQTCSGGVCGASTTSTASPAVSALALSPTAVTGGNSSTGTVTLNMAAPFGGTAAFLSSASAVASVPQSVVVPQGQTTASFVVTTSAVTTSTVTNITATLNGGSATVALTVNPATTASTTSTAQVTLTATGRSGEFVSSSPSGLTVSVGTTGSASFATGAQVTLTVSNGRDAIWSGGCSSGGTKTKSCSFSLNAATSVTANVQ